ncbi:MAG TPA: GC-type dockerin domain-anchored protein [Phycisphaerales bacterium]|nr:GC-type dockerin domain-anchored protein [Phycisphaerales bacterium]
MKFTHRLALTVAACGLASSALAQDSVSPAGALPGDALGVYDPSETCNAYVLDMVDLAGSWGTALRVGPVLKSPRLPNTQFFNNLMSAHAISKDVITAAYPRGTYQVWSGPGFGINGQVNLTPGTTSPSGSSLQFAVAGTDFGTTAEGRSYNGVHGAVVNYSAADDSRLYVTRVSAAVNGFNGNENRAQFGFGVVDAHGNVLFRADDFNLTGPNPLVEDNIFRARLLSRSCGGLNVIDNAGGSDGAATDWLVVRSSTGHTVPSGLPQSVAGRSVYGGPNFAAQYAYEIAPNTVVGTSSHLQGATDQRGGMGVSTRVWFNRAGAVATYAVGSKSSGGATDAVSVWDVDANGNVLNPGALLVLPATLTDNDDGNVFGGAGLEFDGYHGTTAFRGGSGMVALTTDRQGNRLAAATAYDLAIGGTDNPSNAVAVAKHNTSTGATTWTTAAYYDAITDTGKEIKDGPGGAAIGEVTGMFKVTGGTPLGPSISPPAFDCAGNIYFVCAVELFSDFGSDFDVALVRAVYDAAAFSYELELIADSGSTFIGANSGTLYQITFVELATGSGGLASGSFFSSNVVQDCWAGAEPGDLSGTADPRALGGALLNCRITYDTDGDGQFDNTLDENYRTLLLFTGSGAADPCSPADCDGNGVIDTRDVICFLNLWNADDPAADCDGNGAIDTRDVICFLNVWNSCR